MASPLPTSELEKIAEDACATALSSAYVYNHDSVEQWNATIINHILKTLVSSISTQTNAEVPKYKYAVNSTIIQHLSDPSAPISSNKATSIQTISPPGTPAPSMQLGANEATARDSDSPIRGSSVHAISDRGGIEPTKGRRGLHSAMGAYWNNETDGMWSYKFEGGDKKGMDVVISVIWVAV